MPIVQNLARLSGDLMSACATSTAVLHDVCSFRTLDQDDYLDLDWAPAPLEAAAVAARVPGHLLEGLALATGGDDEINRAYREMPDGVWEHPVTSLGPGQVMQVHQALRELSAVGFLSSDTAAQAFIRLGPKFPPPDGDPVDYLRPHFQALSDFYAGAAERRLGALMWWD